MKRVLKSFGVAVAAAVVATVAVPAATVGAADLEAEILYQGSPPAGGSLAIATGTTFMLEVDLSFNVPYRIAWDVVPVVGAPVTGIPSGKIRLSCDREGTISVKLTVTALQTGSADTDTLTVRCGNPPTAQIDPAPPADGQRQMIPVGTTITFRSVKTSSKFDRAWRTTGVSGIAGYGETYRRTFDKVGEFGVQLAEVNEVGRATQWIGYIVVGPPTVTVNPAPANPTERMTVQRGSSITFDGSGSQSPGGGSLVYEWRSTGVPGIAGGKTTYQRTFDKLGAYGVELTVINELGQSAKRWVGVNVVDLKPPIASVTPAPNDVNGRMTVKVGSVVPFDGRGSRDPDGGNLTYAWRTTGEPGVVSGSATYSRRFNTVGKFGVELTVTDDEGQTAKRWVGVEVVR